VVRTITEALVRLVERDGLSDVGEAVGSG
jgi:hypothetical protein